MLVKNPGNLAMWEVYVFWGFLFLFFFAFSSFALDLFFKVTFSFDSRKLHYSDVKSRILHISDVGIFIIFT